MRFFVGVFPIREMHIIPSICNSLQWKVFWKLLDLYFATILSVNFKKRFYIISPSKTPIAVLLSTSISALFFVRFEHDPFKKVVFRIIGKIFGKLLIERNKTLYRELKQIAAFCGWSKTLKVWGHASPAREDSEIWETWSNLFSTSKCWLIVRIFSLNVFLESCVFENYKFGLDQPPLSDL